MNYKELINKKRELIETTKKLDEYAEGLLEKKKSILDKVELIVSNDLKPLKEEISQIDAEVETILKETGGDKIVIDGYGAYLNDEMSIKIVDMDKAIGWAIKNPGVLKKDILKVTEVNRLIKEGLVPDPETDGVDCNDSYQKISFRRR